IGASLFASNIGSEHFIGLAGSGAASGIAVVAFEWGVSCIDIITSRMGLLTYIHQSWCSILNTCLPLYYCYAFLMIRTIYFSNFNLILHLFPGGHICRCGFYSASFRMEYLFINSDTASRNSGFIKVGGINALMYKYFQAMPEHHLYNGTNSSFTNTSYSCSLPRNDAFHILRDPVNSDLPWPGVLIRSTFVSMWYWCADQVIVQRTLSAKNIGHARAATIMAGYLKFLPLFLIIMPGMISRVLFPETVACADPKTCMEVCENPVGCSNVAYPQLVLGLAPVGMRGLMMAVMMAALMSSLTSIFNSAATVFTMDIWRRVRNVATERELLIVGRIFVVILVGISIAWIPLIQAAQQGQLFIYIQAVTGYIVPPVCAVFLLAVFVPRVNEKGALAGLVLGQLIGLTRMILDFVYPKPHCGEVDNRPDIISKLDGLTFWTLSSKPKTKSRYSTVFYKSLSYIPDVALEIHTAQDIQQATEKQNKEAMMAKEILLKKLKIKSSLNWFLNINAALLLCSVCKKENGTIKGFFLAGRAMTWFPIGASLFASNIGSEHFIGLAGTGAASGIAVVAFEWGAVLLLLLLGWVFLPVYIKSGVFTIPEFLSRRFGGQRLRIYLSVMSLCFAVLTKISVDIFAGAVFIQQALGWNIYVSIAILLSITAVYTIAAFIEVDGIGALTAKYMKAIPHNQYLGDNDSSIMYINSTLTTNFTESKCGYPPADAFHIFRDPVTSSFPWPGVLIRSTFVSVWYWCTDQVQTVACSDPETCMEVCDNPVGCSNVAYPQLVLGLAPVGMRGVMIAVIVAAVMSSLTSIFNSSATIFTMDIWRKFRPLANDRELLIVGRIFVVIIVLVSVGWVPLIKSAEQGQLFMYIQAINGYMAPPVCALFLLAIFVPRVTEKGAFLGLLVGQSTGIVRMILDFVYPAPRCGQPDNRPDFISKFHFTYFSAVLLLVTGLIMLIFSLLTGDQQTAE
ncbi:hypothetical protein KUTeg_022103, partial [Tegillarca granosa]